MPFSAVIRKGALEGDGSSLSSVCSCCSKGKCRSNSRLFKGFPPSFSNLRNPSPTSVASRDIYFRREVTFRSPFPRVLCYVMF